MPRLPPPPKTGPRKPANRIDVPLTAAHSVAMFVDSDGEFVLRLLSKNGTSAASSYLTPKIRVDREELESLLLPHDQALRVGGLAIELGGTKAWVRLNGVLAGWTGRDALAGAITRFLEAKVLR